MLAKVLLLAALLLAVTSQRQQYACPYSGPWTVSKCTCQSGYTLVNGYCQPICDGGASWNGKCCVCPDNSVMLNGQCVCDYGYEKVGNVCQRCRNGRCGNTPTDCPKGFSWNGQCCVLDWNTNGCPNGYYWNGVQCTSTSVTVTCAAPFIWNGVACVLGGVNQCPSGTYWNGQACFLIVITPPVCASGYSWDSQTGCCLLDKPVTTDGCPLGYFWNGLACVPINNNVPKVCATGFYYNGLACIPVNYYNPTPVCNPGCTWNGISCVPTPISVTPVCQSGYTYNAATNCCVYNVPQTYCANGQYNNNPFVPLPLCPIATTPLPFVNPPKPHFGGHHKRN